ncbi:MAG: nuclear transport factor 2 family protein [Actinomycetota bacterium]
MSEENVEVARRGYEHFIKTGDILAEIFDPDFLLDMSTFRGWPERQNYPGVEGFRVFLSDWLEAWEDYEFTLEELHDAGDKVVAVVRQGGVSKATGVPVEMHLAHVLTFREGKQIRQEMYASADEALEAAGLRE